MSAVPKTPFTVGLAAALVIATSLGASAQVAGEFVTPEFRRATAGASFGYWDLFEAGPGGGNYLYDNPPALLGGDDFDGNMSDLTGDEALLVQTGTDTAFLTSSGAIYSFAEPVAYEVRFTLPAGAPDVTNVVYQTQTGGVRLDIGDVALEYDAPGGTGPMPTLVAPAFKALDDPQTGGFSERLVSAFQWDLTGLGVRDFVIRFRSPNSSMPIWESQIDVVMGEPFIQALGFVLLEQSSPVLRFGIPGSVFKDLPFGAEDRFHLPGEMFDLLPDEEPGFVPVGFIAPDGSVVEAETLEIVFGSEDLTAGAIFAPEDYDTWRDAFFFHSNSLLGQGPDNTDEAISGPHADPDSDGMSNFTEYVFGCDPYTPDSQRAAPAISHTEVDGERFSEVTYRRWAVPPGESDVAYAISTSGDLTSWTLADTTFKEVASELQFDGTRLVTLRSDTPVGGSQFIQVGVTEVAP